MLPVTPECPEPLEVSVAEIRSEVKQLRSEVAELRGSLEAMRLESVARRKIFLAMLSSLEEL